MKNKIEVVVTIRNLPVGSQFRLMRNNDHTIWVKGSREEDGRIECTMLGDLDDLIFMKNSQLMPAERDVILVKLFE